MEEEEIAAEFLFIRINNPLYISRLYWNLSHQLTEVLFHLTQQFLIGLRKETHLQVSCDGYFEHTPHLSLMSLFATLFEANELMYVDIQAWEYRYILLTLGACCWSGFV